MATAGSNSAATEHTAVTEPTNSHNRNDATEHVANNILSEKRLALNGIAYTHEEFLEYYAPGHGQSMWASATMLDSITDQRSASNDPQVVATEHNAPIAADVAPDHPQAAATELRVLDGYFYSYEIMEAWFNSEAPCLWAKAIPVMVQHLPAPQEQIHATEQDLVQPRGSASTEPGPAGLQSSFQTGATEHSHALPILLAAADVNVEKALEEKIKPPRSLHRTARNTLDGMITAGVDSDIDRNLEKWFDWRRYIACHENAYDIIGAGVTHARAEYIPQTRDSNRGCQERLDFVIYRTDGSTCRLHPGKTRRNDAKLIYSDASKQAMD